MLCVVVASADPVVALQLRMILTRRGFEVLWVRDEQALSEVLQRTGADLVIVDGDLESDGIAVLERLNAANVRPHRGWVLAIDPYDDRVCDRAFEAGAAACVSRGCYPRDVTASVARVLGASRGR